MKRERLTQIVLVIVGLINLSLIYSLYMDLRHSSWLLQRKNEVEPSGIKALENSAIREDAKAKSESIAEKWRR